MKSSNPASSTGESCHRNPELQRRLAGYDFRSRHTDLSCSAGPIFGVDGSLMAVLDVSAIDPERSERAHALTGALTASSARGIEERFFREQFCRAWIIATIPPEEGTRGAPCC